jgi:hypothetical protein
MDCGEASATLKGTYQVGVALIRRTERSEPAKECGQLKNRIAGVAGSRGVRLSSKPKQDDGEWCGSGTYNGDGVRASTAV